MSGSSSIQIDLNDNNTVKLINIVNDVISSSTPNASRTELLEMVYGAIDVLNVDNDLKQKLRSSELLGQLVDGFLNGSVRGTEIAVGGAQIPQTPLIAVGGAQIPQTPLIVVGEALTDVIENAVKPLPDTIEPSRQTIRQIVLKCIRAILSCLPHCQSTVKSVSLPTAPRPSPVQTAEVVHPIPDEPPALELSPDAVESKIQTEDNAN